MFKIKLMKIYKAYLFQEGGCDYTIGCGHQIVDIEAISMTEAKEKILEIIDYYSINNLDSVEIYEISEVFEVDLDAIKYKIKKEEENAKFMQKELEELKEFERLKNKYGK